MVIIVKENHASDPPSSDHAHNYAARLNRSEYRRREQYDQANIPNYWRYAQQFTLCDKYFTEVAGPSTRNHLESVKAGQKWTADQVDALVKGGLWPNTVIFMTWDSVLMRRLGTSRTESTPISAS